MAIRAGAVILAARDRSSAFDKQRHPDAPALRELSAYTKRLHGKISNLDPSLASVTTRTALPLADHAAGIALPAGAHIVTEVSGEWAASAGGPTRDPYPIREVDYHQRLAPNAPRGAFWRQGGKVFLRSPASLWTNFGAVLVTTVATPVDLATLNDTLPLPDACEPTCIQAIAMFLAFREKEENPDSGIDPASYVTRYTAAEADLLAELTNALGTRVFFTEDVYRP